MMKTCKGCGQRMTRKRPYGMLGKVESVSTFKKRQFCSLQCANAHAAKERAAVRIGGRS